MTAQCQDCNRNEVEVNRLDAGGGVCVCLCQACWARWVKQFAKRMRKTESALTAYWWQSKSNTLDA